MVDAIAFAQQLAAEASDPFFQRWAESLEEHVARQALYLMPRTELMSEELRQAYLDILARTFAAISENIKIEISPTLADSLEQIEAPEIRRAVQEHVLTHP